MHYSSHAPFAVGGGPSSPCCLARSPRRISAQASTQASQMSIRGPAMSWRVSRSLLPQKEHETGFGDRPNIPLSLFLLRAESTPPSALSVSG